jgi:hypothetical protein
MLLPIFFIFEEINYTKKCIFGKLAWKKKSQANRIFSPNGHLDEASAGIV